ncbi:MAG: heat-inducible transcriptional repressor HrcA [Christensenellales bacterium]|jgi:heat-inducible transcriptional repressor
MRLDERKLRILRTIIDDYVMTATPIGSRTISKRSELGLSSATIRNEMSDLEEMGFLEQPHTSAGRVPSEKAYRFYVDTMMKAGKLSEEEIAYMRSYFNTRMTEAEEVVAGTAKLLSDLTDYTAMVMSPELNAIIVKHIQLVPVTSGRALAVIVTDAGLVRDSFITIPPSCTPRDLERLSNMVTARVKNMPLHEAVEALKRGAGEEMEEQRSYFTSIADAIAHDISREASRGVILGGATNLLKHPEYLDLEKAGSMLAVFETKEQLYRILSKAAKMEFTVTIGSENELPEMQSSSVVTATYKISGKPVGSFGVIGPIRMDYAKVVTVLNQMGKTLSSVLTGMLAPEDQ